MCVGRLVSAFGSSRIASPAYQEWPTRRGNLFLPTRPRPAFVQSTRASFHSSKTRAPHFLSFANLKFENRSRTFRPRSDRHQSSTSNRSLYQDTTCELRSLAGYPEGNFGRNQLSEGSIGLSPPRLGRTIDLHVRIAAAFHQTFVRLWPARA